MNRTNDNAVSPVIGVILMVAITVILAAVIAAFVFGMAGNIQKDKVVGGTMTRTGAGNITFIYTGGPDAATLIGLNFTVNGNSAQIFPSDVTPITAPAGTQFVGRDMDGDGGGIIINGDSSIPTGTSITMFGYQTSTGYVGTIPINSLVVVTGEFADGSQQVILQNTL